MTKLSGLFVAVLALVPLNLFTANPPSALIVTHRGLLLHAPENKLADFRVCLELHLGFEFDSERTNPTIRTALPIIERSESKWRNGKVSSKGLSSLPKAIRQSRQSQRAVWPRGPEQRLEEAARSEPSENVPERMENELQLEPLSE